MSLVRVSAQLDRSDNGTPWGFRMTGGKDFGAPLVVQKVNPGSLSQRCGLKEGDTIHEIGGYSVEFLAHKEAQQLILSQGNSLNLKLERDSGYGPPPPSHHAAPHNPPYANSPISTFNITPTPFGGFNKPTSNPLPLNYGNPPSQVISEDIGSDAFKGGADVECASKMEIKSPVTTTNNDISCNININNDNNNENTNNNNNDNTNNNNNKTNNNNTDANNEISINNGISTNLSITTNASTCIPTITSRVSKSRECNVGNDNDDVDDDDNNNNNNNASPTIHPTDISDPTLNSATANSNNNNNLTISNSTKSFVNETEDEDSYKNNKNNNDNNINNNNNNININNNNKEHKGIFVSRKPSQSRSFMRIQSSLDESMDDVIAESSSSSLITQSHKDDNQSIPARITQTHSKPFPTEPNVLNKPRYVPPRPQPPKPQPPKLQPPKPQPPKPQPPKPQPPKPQHSNNQADIKQVFDCKNNSNNNNDLKNNSNNNNDLKNNSNNNNDCKMSKGAQMFMNKLQNNNNNNNDNDLVINQSKSEDAGRKSDFTVEGLHDDRINKDNGVCGDSFNKKNNKFNENTNDNDKEQFSQEIVEPKQQQNIPQQAGKNIPEQTVLQHSTEPQPTLQQSAQHLEEHVVENAERKQLVLKPRSSKSALQSESPQQPQPSQTQSPSQQLQQIQYQQHHIGIPATNNEQIVESTVRKQIVVKKTSQPQQQHEQNIPSGGEILESSDRKKIVIKTKSQAASAQQHDQQPLHQHPSQQQQQLSENEVVLQIKDRKQIIIKPKALPRQPQQPQQQSQQPSQQQPQLQKYSADSTDNDIKMHGPSGPELQQEIASWAPQMPTGERKIKLGKAGEAQTRAAVIGGSRTPVCATCHTSIRGPFVAALDKTWCPEHFVCSNPQCKQPLMGAGFVEERGELFCVNDFEKYLAPKCAQCSLAIVGEVLTALKSTYHVGCFSCSACKKPIGTARFHTENGQIYCEQDWTSLFGNVCYGCKFPIEDNERWVEALTHTWHPRCFNCSSCQINLDGKSFCNKGGKPYCKKHGSARGW